MRASPVKYEKIQYLVFRCNLEFMTLKQTQFQTYITGSYVSNTATTQIKQPMTFLVLYYYTVKNEKQQFNMFCLTLLLIKYSGDNRRV